MINSETGNKIVMNDLFDQDNYQVVTESISICIKFTKKCNS